MVTLQVTVSPGIPWYVDVYFIYSMPFHACFVTYNVRKLTHIKLYVAHLFIVTLYLCALHIGCVTIQTMGSFPCDSQQHVVLIINISTMFQEDSNCKCIHIIGD